MTTATTASFSSVLRRKIELVFPLLGAATYRFHSSDRLAEIYPRYLLAMHDTVRATVALIDTAIDRLRGLGDDPLAAPLSDYLVAHRDGELGHDVLVLRDIEALGLDAAALTADRLPSRQAIELVGAQYYVINHLHPVGLLGHIYLLERFQPSAEAVARLIERSGLPAAAFSAIGAHVELDGDHSGRLETLLDALPLTSWHRELIGVNALQSVERSAALIDQVTTG